MLTHRVDGSGSPALLLNGIAMSIASWEPVVEHLHDHRVIRCDLRGQLLSPGTPPADVGEHVGDVVDLLDHLGVQPVHLLATSFGGAVGALLAARHPERVASLVSVASADGFTAAMAAEVRRWRQGCEDSISCGDRGVLWDVLEPVVYSAAWRRAHAEQRELRRHQIASLPERWFRDLMGLLDSADSFELGAELEAVRCPTLIVAAEHDGFIPRERCRASAQAIHGAEFEVLAGAGHAAVAEQPQAVAELARRWFRGRS